mmetsp:Transcript_112674/g.325560  ORF Transcript_112674/g.325560 Transcript_112674/m.325560 type:complete len:220 (+) Transcript_112674:325-984(+)
MSHFGGDMEPSASRSARSSFSLAGSMRSVWKAPLVFSVFACSAFASMAFWTSFSMAGLLPAHEKPSGKRKFATLHVSPGPAASLQSASSFPWGSPATEAMSCGEDSAASCMASARSFTNFSPASMLSTPATVRAVYSPRERPATACTPSTASGLSFLSSSTAASPARYMQGWQNLVLSNRSSGPFRQRSRTSKPSMDFAVASISFTAGMSFTSFSIPTY